MKQLLLTFTAFSALIFSSFFALKAQSYTIITIAGNGTAGYNSDNIQATASELQNPYGICVDASGNVYTADYYNDRIRKVNSLGVITTIAGNGVAGFSGDGGQATAAKVSQPSDVWWTSSGNIYICDEVNNRIRMVTSTGVISTIAGNGTFGFSGDGGPATAAEFKYPFGVMVDGAGNIYVSEFQGERVRKINTAGIITTYAGNGAGGFSGDGGQATAAMLDAPLKSAMDPSGNLYIADAYNNRIRKVTPAGIITTYAGNGVAGFSGDGGQATAAKLDWTFGVGTDGSGNVYACDFSNNRIRLIKTSGVISTIAGNGTPGFNGDGSPATTKELYYPSQITSDASGNLYLSEYSNQRDRKLTNAVLPITLTSFTADYVEQSNTVLCQWVVATQTNNKLFTIEKSTDARIWNEVGTVPGAGNLSFSADYSLTDNEPSTGESYYRLIQTDFDGKQAIFTPVAVTVDAVSQSAILYPNPVTESATLSYYSLTNDEPINITIMDAFGRTIRTLTPNKVQAGTNTLTINTSILVKGIYFIRLTAPSRNSYVKFIKD